MKKNLTKAAMAAMIGVTLCALAYAGEQGKRLKRAQRAYNALVTKTEFEDFTEPLQGSDEYVGFNNAMK